MSAAHPRSPQADTTHYPVVEKMGENLLHRLVMELLRPLLERYLRERGETVLVGADQFFYYEEKAPTKRVAPDIYVLPGAHQVSAAGAWKVWETGVPPSFALEIVSGDVRKDYLEAPVRYAELGAGELVLFDPSFERARDRVRFQVFRRTPGGEFLLVERTNADRVYSEPLGCWLRSVGEGDEVRLRIGVGPQGDELVPTESEAREAERAAKEAERAAKEAERERRLAAEAEVAQLRAEVERLRGR